MLPSPQHPTASQWQKSHLGPNRGLAGPPGGLLLRTYFPPCLRSKTEGETVTGWLAWGGGGSAPSLCQACPQLPGLEGSQERFTRAPRSAREQSQQRQPSLGLAPREPLVLPPATRKWLPLGASQTPGSPSWVFAHMAGLAQLSCRGCQRQNCTSAENPPAWHHGSTHGPAC